MRHGIASSCPLCRHGRLSMHSSFYGDFNNLVPIRLSLKQVHVLAGLGYEPSEQGLGTYNYQLGAFLQTSDPDLHERLRTIGRDLWREVLCKAFNVKVQDFKELSIVDARNMMHMVSQKMQDDRTLKLIAKKCMAIQPGM